MNHLTNDIVQELDSMSIKDFTRINIEMENIK